MEKKCGKKYLLSLRDSLHIKRALSSIRLKRKTRRERESTLYYVFRPETPLLFKNDGRRRRTKNDDNGRMDPVRATAGG